MIKYDLDYYYNLLRIHAGTAEKICKIRWEFLLNNLSFKDFDDESLIVLDYGCGPGFMKAFAPDNVLVDTFDILPVPQTGIRSDEYDIVMLYDVLEHIDWKNNPDYSIENILKKTKYVVVSVPILPDEKSFDTWKHNKPGEHLTRFRGSEHVLNFFNDRNLKCVELSDVECPPREDIVSFLFKKTGF